ncbi:MAG: MFS transporter [Pseudomonadota bacterium]
MAELSEFDHVNVGDTVYRRARRRDGPLPLSTKIYQGLGALPGSHKTFAFSTFLLLYYNQILGVPAGFTSGILALALIVDAVTDPLIGAYSDQIKSRLGRRHPLMYAAALPMGLTVFALFAPPATLSQIALMAWLLFFTVATHLSFTAFVVPWSALQAEFSDDYQERTAVVTYRHIVGWVGGTLFSVSVFAVVFAGNDEYVQGQLNPANYQSFAILLGVLCTFWCLLTAHLTRREIPYFLQPVQARKVHLKMLFDAVILALRGTNFRLILFGTMLYFVVIGVGGVFDVFMTTFFWGLRGEDLSFVAAFVVVGPLAAFGLIPLLQSRYQKHHVVITCLAAGMVLGILKVCLRFADILPENGETTLLVVIIAYVSVEAFFSTIAGILFASMIADLVDEQELLVGYRQEGVFLSALAFSQKATAGFGIIVGGLLLQFFVGMSPGSKAVPAPDELFRLALTDGVLVNVFLVIPIWMMSRYTLTRERLQEIQARLADRRDQQG